MSRATLLLVALTTVSAAGCSTEVAGEDPGSGGATSVSSPSSSSTSGGAGTAGGGTGGAYVAPPCDAASGGAWSTAIHVEPAAGWASPFVYLSSAVPFEDGVVVAVDVMGATADLAGEHFDSGDQPRFDLLARFDACGSPLWARKVSNGAAPSVVGGSIVAPAPLGSGGLARYDADGNATPMADVHVDACLYAATTPGPGDLVLLSGTYGPQGKAPALPKPQVDPAAVGGVSCTTPTGAGAFLLALGADGSFKWLRTFEGSGQLALAVDATSIFVSGGFVGDLDLGGTVLHGFPSDAEPFTARLDPDGDSLWATASAGGSRLALRSDGGAVVSSRGGDRFTLDAIDGAGQHLWSYVSPGVAFLTFLVDTPDDRVVVGAFTEQKKDLAGAPAPEQNAIVATFDGGALTDQRVFDHHGAPSLTAGVLVDGAIIVTGDNNDVHSDIDFGEGAIASQNGDFAFLARVPL